VAVAERQGVEIVPNKSRDLEAQHPHKKLTKAKVAITEAASGEGEEQIDASSQEQ
jgi:hypothetical protein